MSDISEFLARRVQALVPLVFEVMRKAGRLPASTPDKVADEARFKFGHAEEDRLRHQIQMIREGYEINSGSDRWTQDQHVLCPLCGTVTVTSVPSNCGGCGVALPRWLKPAGPVELKEPKRNRVVWLLGFAAVAALIFSGLLVTHFLVSTSAFGMVTLPDTSIDEQKIPGEWRSVRSAIRLIHHFHQATSVEEKASLVWPFPNRRAVLDRYYQSHESEPSLVAETVKTGWYEVDGLVTYLIHGRYDKGGDFLAFVREDAGRLTLDWQAFKGYNEVPLDVFLQEELESPVTMRVVAAGVAGDPLPELASEFRLYALTDKDSTDTCWALVRKHSEAGKILSSLIAPPRAPGFSLFSATTDEMSEMSPTPPRRLMVKLRYDSELGVVIDEVISTEWLEQAIGVEAHFDA